jgi:hypothetical protein
MHHSDSDCDPALAHTDGEANGHVTTRLSVWTKGGIPRIATLFFRHELPHNDASPQFGQIRLCIRIIPSK